MLSGALCRMDILSENRCRCFRGLNLPSADVAMKIDILTLFPEICRTPLSESMMKRAQENEIVDLQIHNLRDWTTDKHHVVDDAPFGGGQGMGMKVEPVFKAVEQLKGETPNAQRPTPNAQLRRPKVILMSPAGRRFDQELARQFSA